MNCSTSICLLPGYAGTKFNKYCHAFSNCDAFYVLKAMPIKSKSRCSFQGCGLGRDVSVSRRSRDVLTSHSVSSRTKSSTSRSHLDLGAICLGLGPVGVVSGLRPLRLVETFCAGVATHTVAAVRAILTSMTFVA